MSDQVQLSAYSEAVQNLIQSERHDEAIAVCQHILSYYPKNVTTYRQMAEANLEKGQFQEAAELFRRVLSADPEDDVAYAGLAAIYEHQALIDEAVWHLERAYELNPGSLEIRKELLRLYGERDGRPHSRVKLTSGALGRLYIREGLFAHAIQEFRSILSENPRRLDARLALAETLFHAGQIREATEVSQELLQALPYCLKANLILGTILQESGANEGETYLRCAQAVDPTNQVAQEMLGGRSPLQTDHVLVPQYVEGAAPAPVSEAEVTEQFAEEAVAAVEAEAGAGPAAPVGEGFEDWFEEGAPESETEGTATPSETPFEVPAIPEEAAAVEATSEEAPALPDWLSTQEQNAQESVAREEPQEEAAMPAWVSQMGLPAELTETAPTEQAPAEEPDAETAPPVATSEEELPPWLLGDFAVTTPPTPRPTAPIVSSLPPWLTEFQKTHQVDSATEPATSEEELAMPAEAALETSAESVEVEPTAPARPTTEAETDWFQLPSSESVPPSASAGEERGLEQASRDQMLQDQGAILVEPPTPFSRVEPSVSDLQTPPAAAEDQTLAEFEEWFEETRAHVAAEAAATLATTEKKPREEPPDWLRGLEVEAAPEAPAPTGEEKQAQEGESPEAEPLAQVEGGSEIETPEPMPLPQELVPTASAQLPAESASVESDVLATPAPAEVEAVEAEPVELEPEGEPGTVTLLEEPADRELYGEVTPPLVSSVELPSNVEKEPTAPAPSAPALDESRATDAAYLRRDPKGYAHLLRARGQREDNRLGEALKEYDYLVQHSPRLINTVISDLEAMVRELDVPLEAHRILGDAYTRADRLADALECYRFVLQRVS